MNVANDRYKAQHGDRFLVLAQLLLFLAGVQQFLMCCWYVLNYNTTFQTQQSTQTQQHKNIAWLVELDNRVIFIQA